MNNELMLQRHQPDGRSQRYVQAVWFARSLHSGTRWLPCDGAQGIVFVLKGEVSLDEHKLTAPFHIQPPSKHAVQLSYSADAEFAGIRLYPARLKALQQAVYPLLSEPGLCALAEQLSQAPTLCTLKQWLQTLSSAAPDPSYAMQHTYQLISSLMQLRPLEDAYRGVPLGIRQLERQVKAQSELTPKYLARIYRVRHAQQQLRDNPLIDLAQLAQLSGFSDQAHLTREFKHILKITPGKYARQLSASVTIY
ncbi:helix-turn-helix domain-containing protein [Pseudoalteromonas sp. McH1-42]|uniref:AraC family transcriptional regulator n=1 Tax=Pseudoalteromonas sp. McH1-42 TaxID=2917752 RepID=UPI001EF5703C|nr:helix-turn-helix domain-containing protein [Pseudoalteromonas sp. McH1-42]MCG7560237.1 helix-turn-helix domain-containing protein [Pseudoalteromonas sp. McH1-42]